MDNFTLLKCVGEIDDRYILSAQRALGLHPAEDRRKPTGSIPFKRYLILAAAVVLALALVGCAILYGLHHLKIGEYTDTVFTEQAADVQDASAPRDVISLQGYVGSVPYKAAREWRQFVQNYDKDGSLLAQADTDEYQEPIEYMAYNCYTQEMQDKIDAICAKYDLTLLGPVYFADYAWQIFDAVGIRTITFPEAAAAADFDAGYFHRDGTFSLGGAIRLLDDENPWPYPVNFQYRCVRKTSFDSVCLSVGDIESFEEWNYVLKDGTHALLALSGEKALILVDKENFFATVNITNPSVEDGSGEVMHMSPAALEAIADAFTFTYEPSEPSPDTLTQPEWFPGTME